MKQKMAHRKLLVLTALAFICISGAKSGIITKCKAEDTKCARESAVQFAPKFISGLPEFKVKQLDPVTFKKIDASSPNLKLVLSDVLVTGLKDSVIKKVKRDKSKKKLFFKLQSTCQLEGQYEIKGQLLILPIEGKGPLHVTLRKAEISVEVDMGEIEKNGETYWDITGWKHSYALKDKSDVVFENLFSGNEVLGQAAREVISQSGNDIILEVGAPVIKAVVNEVLVNVQTFFQNVPAKELSID